MSFELRTRIEIDAPAERVWSILTDFDSYPSWNPLIPRITGSLTPGARLVVKLRAPNGSLATIKPRIVSVEPGVRFAWRGSLPIPGLFIGEHAFALAALTAERVALLHEERFSGLLIPLARKLLDGGVRASFEAMNLALKARAEAGAPAPA